MVASFWPTSHPSRLTVSGMEVLYGSSFPTSAEASSFIQPRLCSHDYSLVLLATICPFSEVGYLFSICFNIMTGSEWNRHTLKKDVLKGSGKETKELQCKSQSRRRERWEENVSQKLTAKSNRGNVCDQNSKCKNGKVVCRSKSLKIKTFQLWNEILQK